MRDGITEAVANALDPPERLSACLPMLADVIKSWRSAVAPDSLAIVCATPRGGIALTAPAWLELPATEADRAAVVTALAAAIETPNSTDQVMIGVCLLLGPEGIAAQVDLAKQMRATGEFPLVTVLTDGRDVATFMTALPLPAGGATIH